MCDIGVYRVVPVISPHPGVRAVTRVARVYSTGGYSVRSSSSLHRKFTLYLTLSVKRSKVRVKAVNHLVQL